MNTRLKHSIPTLVAALALLTTLGACANKSYMSAMPYAERAAPDGNYQDGETYEVNPENTFIDTETEATSTFSIDVDNASYTLMRRDVRNNRLSLIHI